MGELPTAATSREAKTVDLVATGTVEVSPEWLHCDGSRWLSSKPLGALNEDMPLTFPGWVKWTLRVVAWAGWQVVVLYFAFVVYANLFTEYGLYSNRFVDPVAAVVFLMLALWLGTWLPVRKWVARHRGGKSRRCKM